MRIRMLTTSAGPDGVRAAGSVLADQPDEAALLAGGYAEVLDAPIVDATSSAAESAEPAAKPRRGGK